LKRRGEGKISSYQSPLLKTVMKARLTLMKNLVKTAVTVATAVATLKRVEKVLRRLISPAKIAEKLSL
jgi:hypothetical protein